MVVSIEENGRGFYILLLPPQQGRQLVGFGKNGDMKKAGKKKGDTWFEAPPHF